MMDSRKKSKAVENLMLKRPEMLRQAVDTKKSIVRIKAPYVVKCLLYQPGGLSPRIRIPRESDHHKLVL